MMRRTLPILLAVVALLALLCPIGVAGQTKMANAVAAHNGTAKTAAWKHHHKAANGTNAMAANVKDAKGKHHANKHHTNKAATASTAKNATAGAVAAPTVKVMGRKLLTNSTHSARTSRRTVNGTAPVTVVVKKVKRTHNGAVVVKKVYKPGKKAHHMPTMAKTTTGATNATAPAIWAHSIAPGRLLLGATPNAAHPKGPEHHSTSKEYHMPNDTATDAPGRLLLGATPNAAHPKGPEHHSISKEYHMPNDTATDAPGRLLLGATPNKAHPKGPEHHSITNLKAYKMANNTATVRPAGAGRLLLQQQLPVVHNVPGAKVTKKVITANKAGAKNKKVVKKVKFAKKGAINTLAMPAGRL